MPVTEQEASQLKQTGVIFLIGNTLLAPLYYADNKLGVFASICVTLGLGYVLCEEGKKERTKTRSSFFSSPPSESPVEGAFNNILAGGEKLSNNLIGNPLKK